MERIAIIGMGISGTIILQSYAKSLKNQAKNYYKIDCFDSAESFGRGMPFREDSDLALLNSPVDEITLDDEQPQAFSNWLKENNHIKSDYMPRHIFGDFVNDVTHQLLADLDAKAYYTQIVGMDWLEETKKWRLYRDDGLDLSHDYDRVHLACGELPAYDIYGLKGAPQYVNGVYPLDQLPTDLKGDVSVGIIGTGLSAVDATKYLVQDRKINQVLAFSRTHYFPIVRPERQAGGDLILKYLSIDVIRDTMAANHGQYTFDDFERAFKQELVFQEIDYQAYLDDYFLPGQAGLQRTNEHPELISKMQALMTAIVDAMVVGWEAMDDLSREKFTDKYDKILDMTRNPMPKLSAENLLTALAEGKMDLLDEVEDIQPLAKKPGFDIISKDKTSHKRVDWLINASGMDYGLKGDLVDHPLLADLLNKRYVARESAGGLVLNRQTVNLISPRFGEWENLHAHGQIVNGAIYKNGIRKFQWHAEKLIDRLVLD